MWVAVTNFSSEIDKLKPLVSRPGPGVHSAESKTAAVPFKYSRYFLMKVSGGAVLRPLPVGLMPAQWRAVAYT